MSQKQITMEMIQDWEQERNAQRLASALTTDSDEIRRAAAEALKRIDDEQPLEPTDSEDRRSRAIEQASDYMQRVIYMPNKWGLLGVVLALLAWLVNYLNMNTLTIHGFVLKRSLMVIAVVPKLIVFTTYLPILLGIVGLLFARERERLSSIACLVVAITGICWLQWTAAEHHYRAQRAEVIGAKVEAYAKENGTYPNALAELADVPDSDQALVVLIPGVAPGQKVPFTPSFQGRHGLFAFRSAEAPRAVFYLKDVVAGYRLVYQSNGNLASVPQTIDFETLISESR